MRPSLQPNSYGLEEVLAGLVPADHGEVALIAETGYHRRDAELEALRQTLEP